MAFQIMVAETGKEFLLRFQNAEQQVFSLAINAFLKIVPAEFRHYEDTAKFWTVDTAGGESLQQFLNGAKAWLMAELKKVEPGEVKQQRNSNGNSGFAVSFDSAVSPF